MVLTLEGKVKITKRVVDASEARRTRYFVWDEQIVGFGLLVLPTGIKSYVYQFRTPEGQQRRATIGRHGEWTPDQARRKADEWRQVTKTGADPLQAKRELRAAPTVGEIIAAYLESERYKGKAPTTQIGDLGRIRRHLLPLLGKKHVHTLTTEDVGRAFTAIRDGKTAARIKTGKRGLARVTGGEGTAKEAVKLLRSIFGWAINERLIKTNPAAHIKVGSSGTRDTILNGADDYARLFQALDLLEAQKKFSQVAADAIRLIALTGARRGEITGLRWSHVDRRQGLLTLPPAAHKSGKRTGKSRVIGLPAAAQAIIARQPTGADCDLVFPPSYGKGPIALTKPWRAVRAAAGLPKAIGLHGLRHSLASHMAMGGAQAAEIMTALGHGQLSTAQRYVHWAQDSRQGLAERAATTVLAGMAAASKPKGKLLRIKGRP